MHYWKQGEKLYLPRDIEEAARGVQEDHREQHPWEGIIADFLEEEVPKGWNDWDLQKRQVWRSGGMKCDDATAPRQRVCAIEIWCEAWGCTEALCASEMPERSTTCLRECRGGST